MGNEANPLSLAAGVLPEFAPEQVADAAIGAGFRHVGFTIEPADWTDARGLRLRRRLDADAVSVLDVEVAWIPEGGGVTDDHRRLLDAGAALGAAHLLTVSSEADPLRLGEALNQLCERAAPLGMRVALEFLMITPIQTLPQALAAIQACAHPAAALLVDTLHLKRAGHTPADLAAVDPALMSYIQLCDGPGTCEPTAQAYLEDALDRRSAPGEGELPLVDVLRRLPTGTPLSLEVRSRRYREAFPDPTARARAIRERTVAFLEEHGA